MLYTKKYHVIQPSYPFFLSSYCVPVAEAEAPSEIIAPQLFSMDTDYHYTCSLNIIWITEGLKNKIFKE